MNGKPNRLVVGSFLVLTGTVVALLIVWLGRIVSGPLTTLRTVGADHRAVVADRADGGRSAYTRIGLPDSSLCT